MEPYIREDLKPELEGGFLLLVKSQFGQLSTQSPFDHGPA